MKILFGLVLCFSVLCFSARALAFGALANTGNKACQELLDPKPDSLIIKRMAAVQFQLSKNALIHGGKQSQRKVEDIGLRAAYDILNQKLQEQLSHEQYKAALIQIESLVSKLIAKFEVTENKKAQTVAALKSKRMALINKKAELAEEVRGIKIKDLDINVEFPWALEGISRVVRDFSSDSVLLYEPVGQRLLYPSGKSYFANAQPSKDVNDIIKKNHALYINSDGDAVVFSGAYEYIINNKAKVISKSMPFRKKSLVALEGGELFILNSKASKLIIREIQTGDEELVALKGFKIYQNGKKTTSSRDKFHGIFRSLYFSNVTVKSFVKDSKLIVVQTRGIAFTVDIKSGEAQCVDFGSYCQPETDTYTPDVPVRASVDNHGNIYGIFFKNKHKTLEVFKFSPSSTSPTKTTLNIDDTFNSENTFVSAAVDPSGLFIITVERPSFSYERLRGKWLPIKSNSKKHGDGFYLYSMETGERLSKTSILPEDLIDGWPSFVSSPGQGLLMFEIENVENKSRIVYVSKSDELEKIARSTQNIQKQLAEVETSLHQLER